MRLSRHASPFYHSAAREHDPGHDERDVAGIAAGQVLFKYAANSLPARPALGAVIANPYLIGALALYALCTASWIWVLQGLALNRAYPFLSLSFVLVPALSWYFFGETMTRPNLFGIALIVAGVVLASRS